MKFPPSFRSSKGNKSAKTSIQSDSMLHQKLPGDARGDFANGRTSSSCSLQSTTSSKKLQWILGTDNTPADLPLWSAASPQPDAKKLQWILGTDNTPTDLSLWSTSSPRPDAKMFQRRARDLPIEQSFGLDFEISDSDDHDDSASDATSDCGQDDLPELCKAPTDESHGSPIEKPSSTQHFYALEADEVVGQLARSKSPSSSDSVSENTIIAELDKAVEVEAIESPDSPDVEALGIAQFGSSSDSPRSKYDNLTTLRSHSADDLQRPMQPRDMSFDALCVRLLDSDLHSDELEFPDAHSFDTLSAGSPVSSSHSSTIMFPVSSATSISSSASSINSMSAEEKHEKAIVALVADQAALEARLKLAAARDALKRVKSNVAAPSCQTVPPSPISRQHTMPSSGVASKAGIPRSVSERLLATRPTIPVSRSASSIVQHTQEETAGRSSRSTRNHSGRDNRTLQPLKSDVKIGFAAPKNLNLLKRHDDAQHQRTANPAKGKGKGAVYVPQNHITSINEVLA